MSQFSIEIADIGTLMTYDELYDLIHIKYKFVKRPSNEELREVVNEILRLSKTRSNLDDNDLLNILNRNIKNLSVYVFESVDMTDSINIIQQILAKLNSTANG